MHDDIPIAFPELAGELGRQIREASVDYASFAQSLRVCDLGSCRATCCHDGVFLSEEEIDGIGSILREGRGDLLSFGWDHGRWLDRSSGRPKSVTLSSDDVPPEFPSHFPRTRCVFLDEGHRCVLQRLAVSRATHPWRWKPVSCWMHPLVLRPGVRGGRPVLTLPSPGNDPAERSGYPGFASCTPCGIGKQDGSPAWIALRPELELLGRLGGRNLIAEIEAALSTD